MFYICAEDLSCTNVNVLHKCKGFGCKFFTFVSSNVNVLNKMLNILDVTFLHLWAQIVNILDWFRVEIHILNKHIFKNFRCAAYHCRIDWTLSESPRSGEIFGSAYSNSPRNLYICAKVKNNHWLAVAITDWLDTEPRKRNSHIHHKVLP